MYGDELDRINWHTVGYEFLVWMRRARQSPPPSFVLADALQDADAESFLLTLLFTELSATLLLLEGEKKTHRQPWPSIIGWCKRMQTRIAGATTAVGVVQQRIA